jgi:protein involved in polysaccharide export with SLBB domain
MNQLSRARRRNFPSSLGIALAAALCLCVPSLHAQCVDENDGDTLGCPSQLPVQSVQQSQDPPVSLTISQSPRIGEPKADRSNEASASNSLPAGSTFSEGTAEDMRNAGIRRGTEPSHFEPLTEFQRFVAATSGQMLPIYGASLFASEPASFSPVAHAPAPANLIVGAEDELRIRIWGQVNFSANLQVNREGEIYLPKAGAVHVAGLPFSAVADHLRTALERVYRNFELSVDLGEIHSIQIYMTGQARRPGEYTVSALSTLVDAIFSGGGPAGGGSMRHVELRRDGKVIADFDLYALLAKGDKTGDVQLQPGDVLFIPAAGPQVAMLGSVRQAAIFELRGKESIADLLEDAGGRTPVAFGARLSVERIEDHAERRVFELAADSAGLATPLADGDMVRIDPIVSSYRETVTLRGSVANPGHFRWHPGMRLSELMPDRDSLVTRDYWWRRTQLGLPAPQFAPPGSMVSHGEKPEAVSSPGAQTDWDYAVVERLNPATMATSLLPFNLGKLVLDHDMSQDLELQPSDIVTIFAQQDIHMPLDRQTKYVRLEGEFAHAGVYSVAPGETLRSLVVRAGGLTAKAYLYGSEFTRKSTQKLEQKQMNEYTDQLEHELERNSVALAGSVSGGNQMVAVDRDLIAQLRRTRSPGRIVLDLHPQSMGENDLPEMALEDGDALVVPSIPATIQVAGAVFIRSAFLYRGDARVGKYLHFAGGPTRDADRGRAFVLRADGTVSNRGANPTVFASGFDRLRLYPGDTIVVPEKGVRASAMASFLAWTQIVSNMSLGAAAVNVLK